VAIVGYDDIEFAASPGAGDGDAVRRPSTRRPSPGPRVLGRGSPPAHRRQACPGPGQTCHELVCRIRLY